MNRRASGVASALYEVAFKRVGTDALRRCRCPSDWFGAEYGRPLAVKIDEVYATA